MLDLGSSKLNLPSDILLPEGMRNRQPGIYPGVTDDLYHAYDAASQSHLKTLLAKTPMHCRHEELNPPERGEVARKNLLTGSALHALVLQPDRFDQMYVVSGQCEAELGKGGRCGNPGKALVGGQWLCGKHLKKDRFATAIDETAAKMLTDGYELVDRVTPDSDSRYLRDKYDGQLVRISDHAPNEATLGWMTRNNVRSIRVDLPPYGSDDPREVITQDMFDQCLAMRDSLMKHDIVRFVLEHKETQRELTVLWDWNGLLCKSRLDAVLPSHGLILDLKTTVDASVAEFSKSIWNFGYHIQAWFYQTAAERNGIDISDFNIAAVEKTEPYGVQVFRMTDFASNAGGEHVAPALEKYAVCYKTDNWPGYGTDNIEDIELPAWAYKQIP